MEGSNANERRQSQHDGSQTAASYLFVGIMGKERFEGQRGHFADICKKILPHMKSLWEKPEKWLFET